MLLTERTKNNSPYTAIKHKEWLYYAYRQENLIYKKNINDGVIDGVIELPNNYSIHSFHIYRDNLWVIPFCFVGIILVYNLETSVLTPIELPTVKQKTLPFMRVEFWDDTCLIFPYRHESIIKVDIRNLKVVCEKKISCQQAIPCNYTGIKSDKKIIVADNERIFLFNKNLEKIDDYRIINMNGAVRLIRWKESLYFVEVGGLYKLDYSNNMLIKEELDCLDLQDEKYVCESVDGKNLWIILYGAKKLVRLNEEGNIVCSIDIECENPLNYCSVSYRNNDIFFGGADEGVPGIYIDKDNDVSFVWTGGMEELFAVLK